MATATTPRIELNNGVELPTVGLGVFQSPPAETVGAVEAAIADGYRLIDTAAAYGNEREVGEGIRRSGVDRDEMFVSTKLWISDYGYEPALRGFDGCLRRLGLDYVDLAAASGNAPTIWDLESQRPLVQLFGHQGGVGPVDFSPDGSSIVSGGVDRTVRIWRCEVCAPIDEVLPLARSRCCAS